jgi:competence protein ComEA
MKIGKILLTLGLGFALSGAALAGVNVNSASESQLAALPGIGPVTAKAIVNYRASHAPFRSLRDLGKVGGVGRAKAEALKGLVEFGATKEPALDRSERDRLKKKEPAGISG